MGVGTQSPVRDLQLHTADASSELMLSNSTTGATAGSGFMIQQDGNDNYIWNKENSFMSFGTNATERMRITSDGTVNIGSQTNPIDIKHYTTNSGTLSFEASAGQLFSITNELSSGSIFSVNDISGIPK